MNKPVYDYQSLDAVVEHAYYVRKHLTIARQLGTKAANYVQSFFPGPEHRARNALLYMELEKMSLGSEL